MLQIEFYETKYGRSEVSDFLEDLYNNNNLKSNRIILNKYKLCKKILQDNRLKQCMPHVEFLQDGIWQLRPLPYRILFFASSNKTIVLLSVFKKKTKKTPKHIIEKAKKLRKDWENRNR